MGYVSSLVASDYVSSFSADSCLGHRSDLCILLVRHLAAEGHICLADQGCPFLYPCLSSKEAVVDHLDADVAHQSDLVEVALVVGSC